MQLRFLTIAVLLLPASCVTPSHHARAPHRIPRWSAPPLDEAVSVRDGRTGVRMTFDTFLDAVASADVVFLGETHNDETTHRVELAVYEGLLARRSGGVVLAMEMFERDMQAELDSYLAGRIDESAFLAGVRSWPNYRAAYRPLIERARASGLPVVASNFPRALRRRVAMEGPAVLKALETNGKRLAPSEFFPNTEEYWRRVDNAVRSHRGMMGDRDGDEQRLYSTQSLWDNAMGEACAVALDKHPGDLVLHVNGGFHSAYWDGTVHQLLLRKPHARVITVSIDPAANPTVVELAGAPRADFVVLAEARATDVQDGFRSVYVQSERKYRFHLPEAASDKSPVPLLIWLSDDGLTASNGLELWKDRLGEDAAIAVVEAPYRGIQADLAEGGRWYWTDSFSSDIESALTTVERVWGYLLRHYPIDPTRVCVAGEGTGATVVAAVGLLTDRMNVNAISLAPKAYAKIKDFSLPLPELQGDAAPLEKSLRLVVGKKDETWWTEELREYTEIGLDNVLATSTNDPWQTELEAENTLRAALGFDARVGVTSGSRRYILVENDSPRARHWARLLALRYTGENGVPVAILESPPDDPVVTEISVEIHPESFSQPGVLPRCPGPFGGTTVVVLPKDATSLEVKGWIALEEADPLHKKSRFHRLRVATAEGDRALPVVLSNLQAGGRRNVLIVPATFCAKASTMRALKRSVRTLENKMTLHWLPGLGGRKVPISSVSGS